MSSELYNRLVRALIHPMWAFHLQAVEAEATRWMTSGGLSVLVQDAAFVDDARLKSIVEQHKVGVLHVVFVGAGPEMRARVRKLLPFWQLRRSFVFHNVSADLELACITGGRQLGAL